jgi:hypothetical protein
MSVTGYQPVFGGAGMPQRLSSPANPTTSKHQQISSFSPI